MIAGRKLLLIVVIAALLTSFGSHFLVRSLGIHTKAASGHKWYGPKNSPATALIAGSSLTYDGLDWEAIGNRWNIGIESWPVPGSSPPEWEQLQGRSPQATITFVGVSAYDLNEAWLCDFRAEIVPLCRTVSDLWHSRATTSLAKRVLSCYPRMWVRKAFPTVGRSQGVLSGLRDRAEEMLRRGARKPSTAHEPLRLAADGLPESTIMDWPHGRLVRRLAAMRSLTQGRHLYMGPKRLALFRLLQRAKQQGAAVVVVLPVSPPYVAELLGPDDLKEFEQLLLWTKRQFPQLRWVRLDRVPELHDAELFYDLVHLNLRGRRAATEIFFDSIGGPPAPP